MLKTCAVGCVVTSVCQNCGSRRFRADRALAGRLICQSCGLAAGSRPSRNRSNQRQRRRSAPQLSRQRLLWLMLLIGVAIAVVVLTS